MSCEDPTECVPMGTLTQLLEKHRAIARYRLYLFEPRKPRKQQKTYVRPFGLHWDDANARRDELNAALKAAGKDRFTDPLYGVELENGWECMSQAARDRHILLGKGPADFTLMDDSTPEAQATGAKEDLVGVAEQG